MTKAYNKTIIIGRLGEKPELKTADCGTDYTRFSMCNTTFNNGVEVVQWHKIIAFGKQARVIAEHLNKGDLCCIEGRVDRKKYEKEGETKYAVAIIAECITFLSSKRREQLEEQADKSE